MESIEDRDAIRQQLLVGEQILWVGRPDPGKVFTGNDLFLIPFNLLIFGFAIFWTVGAASSGASPFFLVWGSLFIGVSGVFTFGRLGLKAFLKRRTHYGVTTRRLISVVGRQVSDSVVRGQTVSLVVSRSGRHLTVTVGHRPNGRGSQWSAMYENSGLDLFSRTGTGGRLLRRRGCRRLALGDRRGAGGHAVVGPLASGWRPPISSF